MPETYIGKTSFFSHLSCVSFLASPRRVTQTTLRKFKDAVKSRNEEKTFYGETFSLAHLPIILLSLASHFSKSRNTDFLISPVFTGVRRKRKVSYLHKLLSRPLESLLRTDVRLVGGFSVFFKCLWRNKKKATEKM